jgi:hypothetical protein
VPTDPSLQIPRPQVPGPDDVDVAVEGALAGQMNDLQEYAEGQGSEVWPTHNIYPSHAPRELLPWIGTRPDVEAPTK